MDCDKCEGLAVHEHKDPNCEKCFSVQLLPGNATAYNVYTMVRSLGPMTFEAVDRAMTRLGVEDIDIMCKVSILNNEYETIKTQKQKEKRENRGTKRR